MMTRVKVCGIRNEDDLKAAVEAGADAVGFLVGQLHVSPHFVLPGTAARLNEALPPFVQGVLVTHLVEPADIAELIERTRLQTVQLHGGCTPEQVTTLRAMLPGSIKLIVAAHLTEERQIFSLMDFYSVADAILLDSEIPGERRVGGTGIPCNWELAAKFRASSPIPVILAGGLAADNVADAIRKVTPYAVDANTRLKNESGAVDFERCRAFCATAHGI